MSRDIPPRYQYLNGGRAILAAVMHRAVRDLTVADWRVRRDALRYFESDMYRLDLRSLDLPGDLRPLRGGLAPRPRASENARTFPACRPICLLNDQTNRGL